MSFNDLISKVESLLNLKADYEALKAESEAKIAELEANLAKYMGAPSNDDIAALNSKIDNALNPPAPAETPAQ
jgi:outer membrane protein TolC